MNEAHEHVTDSGTVLSFIEKRVFPEENSHLQSSFADIVIQGSSRFPQEESQRIPPFEHVGDGISKAAIGFDSFLIKLGLHPLVQTVHDRTTFFLMEIQPLLRRHSPLLCQSIVAVDRAEFADDVSTFVGEILKDVGEVASSMAEAIAEDGLKRLREIAGKPVAHLDGRRQIRESFAQQVVQVLPGMVGAGEEKCDRLLGILGDDSSGEEALSLVAARSIADRILFESSVWIPVAEEAEDFHRRIVVVDQVALSSLHEQWVKAGMDLIGGLLTDFPLSGSRQRHTQILLDFLNAVERNSGTVREQADHAAHTFIVFLCAGFFGCLGGVDFAAKAASEFFQFVDGGLDERLPEETGEHSGFLLPVEPAFFAIGLRTGISRT